MKDLTGTRCHQRVEVKSVLSCLLVFLRWTRKVPRTEKVAQVTVLPHLFILSSTFVYIVFHICVSCLPHLCILSSAFVYAVFHICVYLSSTFVNTVFHICEYCLPHLCILSSTFMYTVLHSSAVLHTSPAAPIQLRRFSGGVCHVMKITHHHHQSLNREGRWGTIDDFANSFLHFPLFSIALRDLPNSRPVLSLMLSSHLSLCRPCLLPPFTVPSKMVLARPDERETWPYHCSLRLFTIVRRSLCGPIACWILITTVEK